MERDQLEHVLRAAQEHTGNNEFIVIGSQSILGAVPHAPRTLTFSSELDLYIPDDTENTKKIDDFIGRDSLFADQWGFYADGCGPETSILPDGWRDRTIPVQNQNTNGAIGHCLHPADLAVAKLCAGRDKDIEFVENLIRHRIVSPASIKAHIALLPNTVPSPQQLLETIAERAGQPAPPTVTKLANPALQKVSIGRITEIDDLYVTQQVGANAFLLHERSRFDVLPDLKKEVRIVYENDRASLLTPSLDFTRNRLLDR